MKYPIKVLFYTEKWCSGGIESFIMNLYRNLDIKKFKVSILTSQNETDIYDKEIEALGGEKTITLDKKYNSPILRTLRNFNRFNANMKINKYDVVHLHICHGVAMIYAYFAKKNGVKKVILHSHNTNVGNKHKGIKTFGHVIGKYLFEKYADEYFACSDLASQWLYTKKTINSGKVKIINNGIESKKFIFDNKEREKTRELLNINDKFVIGNIGRFSEQKNHEYLIEIFKEISEINKNAILFLVGDGELKQSVVNKVEKLGIIDKVIFYGLTDDVPRILWAMDVFVLPSLFEGKPVVVVETQAAGLKTYISDTITKTVKFSEYVEYLSIKDEPKKWAEIITKDGYNYDRKNMYEIMIHNNYEIKEIAKSIEKLYLDL